MDWSRWAIWLNAIYTRLIERPGSVYAFTHTHRWPWNTEINGFNLNMAVTHSIKFDRTINQKHKELMHGLVLAMTSKIRYTEFLPCLLWIEYVYGEPFFLYSIISISAWFCFTLEIVSAHYRLHTGETLGNLIFNLKSNWCWFNGDWFRLQDSMYHKANDVKII